MDLKKKKNLTYLFISHDLSVFSYVADKVIVMYRGHVVESGAAESVFAPPLHPYTNLLISSRPELGKNKCQLCAQRVVNTEPENDKTLNTYFTTTVIKPRKSAIFRHLHPTLKAFSLTNIWLSVTFQDTFNPKCRILHNNLIINYDCKFLIKCCIFFV
jgi:ABC-type oligopeptide transport system ATPase subunit